MIYIQRYGQGYRETVDQFESRREAKAALIEYKLADPSAFHYLSTRPCRAWSLK